MIAKKYNPWWICAGCALILFCTSGLSVNAFSVYMPFIRKANSFSNSQISYLILIRNLFSLISMLLTDFYFRKLNYRLGLFCAGLLVVISFFLYGQSSSYVLYCASSAIMGIGYGLGTMIPITILIQNWFISHDTLAISICSAITGVSTLGIPSLISKNVEQHGLRFTLSIEGICIAVLVFAAFLMLQNPVSNVQRNKDSVNLENRRIRLNRKEIVLIVVMLLLLGAVTNAGYSHLSMLTDSEGFSSDMTAIAIMISGISLTLGKIFYGVVADRRSVYFSNWIFGILAMAGIGLFLVMHHSLILLFLGMFFYGAGLSFTTVGLAIWAKDLSNPEKRDQYVRYFQIGYVCGSLLFSAFPGVTADFFGGSYLPAYAFFAFCALFVLLSIQFLYKRHHLA